MEFQKTAIHEVILIKPKVFSDSRGFFMETYRTDLFAEHGIHGQFVQDNHSLSSVGILRGLHYQLKHPQGKLVRAVTGAIHDVAVDMRRSSPTFGKWVGQTLSADNQCMLWVPPGFAHGFYVLEDQTHIIYKCTDYYAPQDEHSLLWDDPEVKVKWPVIEGYKPQLSAKDSQGKRLKDCPTYL